MAKQMQTGKARAGRLAALLLLAGLLACAPVAAWAASGSSLTTGTTNGNSAAQTTVTTQSDQAVAFTAQTINMKTSSVKGSTITPGNYIICSGTNAQKLIVSPNNKNKARVNLADQSRSKYQIWNFRYDSGTQAYVITNAASKKVLTRSGTKVTQTKLIKGTKKGWKNQLWMVKSTASGYMLVSYSNKKYSISITDSGEVKMAKNSSSNSMRFWICSSSRWNTDYAVKNGTYTLKSAAGNYLVQPRDNVLNTGTCFALAYQESKNLAQMYDIKIVKSGLYKIINVGTTKALTASDNKYVVEKKFNGDAKQLWSAKLNSDGTITFTNKKFGWVLSLASSSASVGTALIITPTDSGAAQHWSVSPTTTGLTTTQLKGLAKVSRASSGTYMSLVLDLTRHELMIFTHNRKKNTAWTLKDSWKISCGANKSTLEWVGKKTQFRYTNPSYKGYSCYYWSRMGHQQYMHSIIYRPGTFSVMDGSLGRSNTNGCVRMSLAHAKYIYYKVPGGTRVERYYN